MTAQSYKQAYKGNVLSSSVTQFMPQRGILLPQFSQGLKNPR